jgi:hypothetical protein
MIASNRKSHVENGPSFVGNKPISDSDFSLFSRTRPSKATRLSASSWLMTNTSPQPVNYIDQFIQDFHQSVEARTPSLTEFNYWNDILRRGHAAGSDSLRTAAVDFGRTLFESSEYLARQRNDHWYVYDLYRAYCQRDPDSGGWAFWESQVPSQGRENVRHAFEEGGEFTTILNGLTPNGSPSAVLNDWASRLE